MRTARPTSPTSRLTSTLHVSHPEYVESDIDFSKIYRIGEGKTEPLGYISYSDSGVFELSFTCSIGTPTFDMKEYSGNEFIIPFYGTYRVTQAPGGKLSHSGPASRYAVDISMPIGTPVRASRRGRVVNMKMNSTTGGPSPAYRPFANFIRILHDDGTSSILHHRAAPPFRGAAQQRREERGNTVQVRGDRAHAQVWREPYGALKTGQGLKC